MNHRTAGTTNGSNANQVRATVGSLRSTLRQALRDETVEVLYWLPDRHRYVNGDDHGGFVEPALDSAEHGAIRVSSRSGEPLALVLAHPATRRDRQLTDIAIASARLALENVRLQAAMGAPLAELRTARTRVAELALGERRRLERDLHDGAQQRLLGLAAWLSSATRATTIPPRTASVTRVRLAQACRWTFVSASQTVKYRARSISSAKRRSTMSISTATGSVRAERAETPRPRTP